jgi:hypothetical protein
MSGSNQSLPSWLFSNNPLNPVKPTTAPNNMGKKSTKAAVAKNDVASAPPPGQLMDLVENFLSDHSFKSAADAFKKQREKKGWQTTAATEEQGNPSLVGVFQTWEAIKGADSGKTKKKSSKKMSKGSDSSHNKEEDVDMKDAESSSESSGSDSEEEAVKPAPSNNLKRKAPVDDSSSESSSDSDSDSDSSSSDSDSESGKKPQAKKRKRASSSFSSSSESIFSSSSRESDSSSDSDDESAGSDSDSDSDSSDSSSDSSSESDSDSDSDSYSSSSSGSEGKAAAEVPLPDSDGPSSDSDSSDSSDSESDSDKKKKKVKKEAKDSSDSSVTLDKTSPEFQSNLANPPLPPDPVVNGNGKKKQNEPFSRIPKDIKVDPRFASNEYVSITYSQRAHEDLIVTKGKGFTKEKNKKKRGSYRGGAIDISDKKGIYFDD